MLDMKIFYSDPTNLAILKITGWCTGITKLANEVLYNIYNTMIEQGYLTGVNITGDISAVLSTTIMNIEKQIKRNQLTAKLPPSEKLSSLKITSIAPDPQTGSIVINLNVISEAGANAPAQINLGA